MLMLEKYLVFTGRPNAGKSRIIKKLLGFDVKSGKKPGTTRRISKYPLSRGLVLVDMPGFGVMTGASKRLTRKINDRIIAFIESSAQTITLAVHVLDISTFPEVTERLEKKGFISVDVELVKLLEKTLGVFPLVVANKIDKIGKKELKAVLEEFMYQISDGDLPAVQSYVFPVSAQTGEGISTLKIAIHEKLLAKGYRTPFKP